MAQAALSLVPALLFLAGLKLADTYKLLKLSRILWLLLVGCLVAGVCYVVNTLCMMAPGVSADVWRRTGAPIVEEVAKAAYIAWMVRHHRVGFMVDAAVAGFAVGAGFAFIENLTYLPDLMLAGLAASALRGLGTAMMHGGTTALFGIVSISRAEIRGSERLALFWPGLLLAIAIHLLYNQPFLPRVPTAAVVLVFIPTLVSLGIWRGEAALKNWLGSKLDKDIDLLNMISTGAFTQSPAGSYLQSLGRTFAPVILGDMLCYLQLSLELSALAKGDLLRKEMGFPLDPDPELPGRLEELQYLETQIGRAGKRALAPLLGTGPRDIWELKQLRADIGGANTV